MSFLKDKNTLFPNGFYWCCRKEDDIPCEDILKFICEKEGYLVPIDGFNQQMIKIVRALYADKDMRSSLNDLNMLYRKHYKRFSKKMCDEEEKEKKRDLTASDYLIRGNRECGAENYDEAT